MKEFPRTGVGDRSWREKRWSVIWRLIAILALMSVGLIFKSWIGIVYAVLILGGSVIGLVRSSYGQICLDEHSISNRRYKRLIQKAQIEDIEEVITSPGSFAINYRERGEPKQIAMLKSDFSDETWKALSEEIGFRIEEVLLQRVGEDSEELPSDWKDEVRRLGR
ncbi:MAG: hypothetical protein AAF226_01295 [Verrucomicrobiota bacterium]